MPIAYCQYLLSLPIENSTRHFFHGLRFGELPWDLLRELDIELNPDLSPIDFMTQLLEQVKIKLAELEEEKNGK